MKKLLLCLIFPVFIIAAVSCSGGGGSSSEPQGPKNPDTGSGEVSAVPEESEQSSGQRTMRVNIGGRNYTAILEDNEAADYFCENIIPSNYEMSDLNDNEKYVYVDDVFPVSPEEMLHIESGEILIFGQSCIVIFYQSADSGYSYTRIGRITEPELLSENLGPGNVTVYFREGD